MKQKFKKILALMLAVVLSATSFSTTSLLSVSAEEAFSKTIEFAIGQGISTRPNGSNYYGYRNSTVYGVTNGGVSGAEGDYCLGARLYDDAWATKEGETEASLGRRSKIFTYGDTDAYGTQDILPAGEYEVTFWAKNVEETKGREATGEEEAKAGYEGKNVRIALTFHSQNVIDARTEKADNSGFEKVTPAEGEVTLEYTITDDNTIQTLDLFNYGTKTYVEAVGTNESGWTQYKTTVTLAAPAAKSAIWVLRSEVVGKVDGAEADRIFIDRLTITPLYTVAFEGEDGTAVLAATQYSAGTTVTPETPSKEATAEASYEFIGWAEWDSENSKFVEEDAASVAAKTITILKDAIYRPVFKETKKVTVTVPFGIGQGISTRPNKSNYYGYRNSTVYGVTNGGVSGADGDYCLGARLYDDAWATKEGETEASLGRRSKIFTYGDSNEDGAEDILPAGEYEVTFWAKNVEETKSGYAGKNVRIALTFHSQNVIDARTEKADNSGFEKVTPAEGEVTLEYTITSDNTILTLDLFHYGSRTYIGETGESLNGWTQYKTKMTLTETAAKSAVWVLRSEVVSQEAGAEADRIFIDGLTIKSLDTVAELRTIEFVNDDETNTLFEAKQYFDGDTITLPSNTPTKTQEGYTCEFEGWAKWNAESSTWDTENLVTSESIEADESALTVSGNARYKAVYKETKIVLSIENDVGDYTYFNNIYCNTNNEKYENVTLRPGTGNEIVCTRFKDDAYKDKNRTTHILLSKQSTSNDCYFDVKIKKLAFYNSSRIYDYFKLAADIMVEDVSQDYSVQIFTLKDTSSSDKTIWSKLVIVNSDGSITLADGTVIKDVVIPGTYTRFTASMDLDNGTYNLYIGDSTEPVAENISLGENFKKLDVARISFNTGTGKMYVDNCEVTGLIEPYESGIQTSIFPDTDVEQAYLADKISFHAYAELMYKKVSAEAENAEKIALSAKPVYDEEKGLYISAEDAVTAFGEKVTVSDGTVTANGTVISETKQNEKAVTVFSVNALAEALGLDIIDDGQGMVILSEEEIELDLSGEVPFHEKEYPGGCYVVYPTVMESLNRFLFFARPKAEEIKALFDENTNNGKAHPRIMATAEDFSRLRKAYESGTDETLKKLIDMALESAETAVNSTEQYDYKYDDQYRTYATATALKKNMLQLGFGYQMTGEKKYIDRAWELFEAMSTFPDFNTSHIIDTGMYCLAGAIGYDWMHDGFTEEQKKVIEGTIISLGIEPLASAYYGRLTSTCGGTALIAGAQPKWTSNYNTVVTSGFLAAVLAFADEIPDDKGYEYVEQGLRAIEATLIGYAPDGGWVEGPAYWDYSTRYLMYGVTSLQAACGTDFGLMKYNGLDETCDFLISQTSWEGWNNFHDAVASKKLSWCPYNYMAGLYNKPYYQDLRCYALLNSLDTSINPMDVLYYSTELGYDESRLENIANVTITKGIESFSIRDGFLNEDGLYLAGHFGATTAFHSHCDTGAFVLDMLGERWALDLGKEDYAKGFNRAVQYRNRAEGHNTLFIQNTTELEQTAGVFSPIIKSGENESSAFVIADCSDIYTGMSSYLRGFYVGDGKSSVTIRDEFTVNEADTTVYWSMHTEADIEKISDTEVELTQNGKVLTLKLDTNATAAEIVGTTATPLEGSPSLDGQSENTGVNKVLIKLTCTGEVALSVKIAPKGEYGDTTPIYSVDLADWTVEESEEALEAAGIDYSFQYYIDGEEADNYYVPVVNGSVLEVVEVVPTDPNNTIEYEDIDSDGDGVKDVRIYKIYDATHQYYRTVKAVYSSTGSALLKYYDEIAISSIIVSEEPEENNPGVNAIDGDLSTRWFAANKNLNTDPAWAILDLGSVQNVDAVAISSWKGNQRAYNYAIYTSVDGENYEPAVTFSGSGTTEAPEIGMFAQTTQARYIKYVAMGNSVNKYSNVMEFKVLTTKTTTDEPDATPTPGPNEPSITPTPTPEPNEPSVTPAPDPDNSGNNDGAAEDDDNDGGEVSEDVAKISSSVAAAPTGDHANLVMWLMLLAISIGAFAAVFIMKHKKKENVKGWR